MIVLSPENISLEYKCLLEAEICTKSKAKIKKVP